jgi:hypothetical protein
MPKDNAPSTPLRQFRVVRRQDGCHDMPLAGSSSLRGAPSQAQAEGSSNRGSRISASANAAQAETGTILTAIRCAFNT